MIKYLIHIFLIVLVVFVVVTVLKNQTNDELPAFAKVDDIVRVHLEDVTVKCISQVKPSAQQIDQLKVDYSALWAHLNHLYNTNDVEAGKEYYTEGFFKAICDQQKGITGVLTRIDQEHNITITEWARDGLVCLGIDSNVILQYQNAQEETQLSESTIAFALLFEGEHWRIDAIDFINEEIIH